MKSLIVACMLIASTSNGQGVELSRHIQDRFPSMCKALEISSLVKGKDKDVVMNMMCGYSVFARGMNEVVYMDSDTGCCFVTVLFSFTDERCVRLEVTMSYNEEDSLRRDAESIINRFNWIYNGHADMDAALANYNARAQYVSRSLIWHNSDSYVQMSFIDKQAGKSIQILFY